MDQHQIEKWQWHGEGCGETWLSTVFPCLKETNMHTWRPISTRNQYPIFQEPSSLEMKDGDIKNRSRGKSRPGMVLTDFTAHKRSPTECRIRNTLNCVLEAQAH
ncbi:hypothetical protein NPIL_414811 [Nephila pilipes]|uniref:Uncharacterized protein n=1 Tax=Nephila pilipes TaxID=299642 RepID=A0A8X6I666_NEPPI|nr:hypothetical protein NPIL_414811 [Nephila pilipes]